MPDIKCECDECYGTGLYRGMCEGKGEAVVCIRCQGKGWSTIRYREFTGRRKLNGVKSIRVSRGSFIATGVGGKGDAMTYEQFEKKYRSA